MLIHHSLRNPDRMASGRSPAEPSQATAMPPPPTRRPSRSPSPLKFLARKQPEPVEPAETRTIQKRWTADYLAELRKPSGARPMGARPPPGGRASMTSLDLPRASSSLSLHHETENPAGGIVGKARRSISPFRIARAKSAADGLANAGRPLAREPDITIMEDIARTTAEMDNVKVSIDGREQPMPYYERGQRWMERQEARSLRAAMDHMDTKEEKRVHVAAQKEAAELVWKHRFPEKPYENPDTLKHTIGDHLRKGSHARSQSIGPFESLYVTKGGVGRDGKRISSDSSNSTEGTKSDGSRGSRVVSTSSKGSNGSQESKDSQDSKSSSGSRRYASLSFRNPAAKLFGSRRSSRKSRNSSGGKSSSLFANPRDKIYEEPEAIVETPKDQRVSSTVLNPKSRNISGGYPAGSDFLAKTSFIAENKYSIIDIHINPPSQSRDPSYTRNEASPASIPEVDEQDKPLMKDGKEIRGDDIRAATSMRLKDRSENLPTPTYVSDSPGRPIVSFNSHYRPKDANDQRASRESTPSGARPLPGRSSAPRSSLTNASMPARREPAANTHPRSREQTVPSISLPGGDATTPEPPSVNVTSDNIPSVNVPFINAPSISVPSINEPHGNVPSINMPCVNEPNAQVPTDRDAGVRRNVNRHSIRQLQGHWSPAAPRGTGAQCHTCGRHIAGRTLSAAGERFHPECFNCFACGTNLEHVAFYPEPDKARAERLASELASSMPDSQDMRFFCHLDFHENFSPRCKSCKTPIEGEVVLACGSHWHQGHFFCAQCGDPFDGEKPFIEKDGWAWCVGCYKGRYSGKCRGCRKPVIENGVEALGAEWHVECFRCSECSGPFEDGRFFTRGEGTDPVCVGCEERRLKA